MGSRPTRLALWLSISAAIAAAQLQPADQGYTALREKDYDRAITRFREALALAPGNSALRQDLAYTLLKTGDTEGARDQFAEVMRLDPKDDHVALEYAYLCYETAQPVQARRVFDRLKRAGNRDAAAAFENVDRPLREGIARWREALAIAPGNFSAHEELGRLAAQRDDAALAAEHYEHAWRLRTERRDLLLELGRAWQALGRTEDANAAWIAAWRGGTPRVSEQARGLMPGRYPYLPEFQKALALDPANTALQRDVAASNKAIRAASRASAARRVAIPARGRPRQFGERRGEQPGDRQRRQKSRIAKPGEGLRWPTRAEISPARA